VRSFYEHKLPLVDLPEKARDLKAGAQEALAGIRHEFARDVTMSWELKKKRRTPIRVLEKRARTLNSNAKLLEQVPNGKKKEKIIRLALKTGMSPKKLELELENLLPKTKDEERAAPFENHDEMVQAYCPRDSVSMPEVKDGSVRLILTSPPYGGKIAFEGDYLSKAKTPNEFFSQIEPMVQEWFRKLMPGGKAVINWADPIGNWANKETTENGEYAEHIYAHKWVELAEKAGFKLWARQIWHKNVFYSIAQRRVRYEDALHTNGKTHLDWEWLLTFRKPGPAPEGRSKLSYQKWKKYTKGVWYIKGARSSRGLAAFPPELVSRLIQLYSFKGDLVLDPFLGTGTTVAVAKKLGRRGVGYEINPDLKAEIKRTLERA
jgi:DNA modification methylase